MFLAFLLLLAMPPAAPASAGGGFEQLARQAEQYRQTNRFPEAIQLYREGLRQRPSWGEGWLALGTMYYVQDRFPEARDALAKSTELMPPSAFTYLLLGLSEYQTGDYGRAMEHLRKGSAGKVVADKQLASVVNFHMALLLTRLGRFEEALPLLNGLVQQWKDGPELTEAMGLAWLRIASLPREYPPERREAVWLAGEAARLGETGDLQEAQEFAGRLEAHYGQQANVHYLRGMLYQSGKQYDQAIAEFKQELAISPASVASMLQLSELYRRQSLANDAITMARHAAELRPDNAQVCHEFGQALLLAGSSAQAIRQLEKARRLAPDDSAIRQDLAEAYKSSGRIPGTRQEALRAKGQPRPSSRAVAPGKQENSR